MKKSEMERQVRWRLKMLRHVEESRNVALTCRYYGISRLQTGLGASKAWRPCRVSPSSLVPGGPKVDHASSGPTSRTRKLRPNGRLGRAPQVPPLCYLVWRRPAVGTGCWAELGAEALSTNRKRLPTPAERRVSRRAAPRCAMRERSESHCGESSSPPPRSEFTGSRGLGEVAPPQRPVIAA